MDSLLFWSSDSCWFDLAALVSFCAGVYLVTDDTHNAHTHPYWQLATARSLVAILYDHKLQFIFMIILQKKKLYDNKLQFLGNKKLWLYKSNIIQVFCFLSISGEFVLRILFARCLLIQLLGWFPQVYNHISSLLPCQRQWLNFNCIRDVSSQELGFLQLLLRV